MHGLSDSSSDDDSSDFSVGSIATTVPSLITTALTAEASQNLITQQNATAQALLAYNAARAANGLAPVTVLGGSSMSTGTLLLLGAVAAVFILRKK